MFPSLHFAGHEFVAAGEAALFWPKHRALIVADLHLEKASWFAKAGQMLPPYDSLATLQDVAALTQQYNAQAVWCLGDNFHDSAGEARLTEAASDLLRQLTIARDWVWIVGNHDPDVSARWGGRVVEEHCVDDIHLRHAADPRDCRAEMSGHYHPKYRQHLRGRMVSRRCFVRSESKLIFPAFGAFTGGLDAEDVAIARACGDQQIEALVPVSGRVLTFQLGEIPVS